MNDLKSFNCYNLYFLHFYITYRKKIFIELNKKPGDDLSRYIKEIREYMAIDFNIKSSIYKPYILEVIQKVNS